MDCSISLPKQPHLSQKLHKQRYQQQQHRIHRDGKFSKCTMRHVISEIKPSRPTVSCNLTRHIQREITSVASMWREIQGSNDWDNLIRPLNPVLRDEIIRYGELVNACYKSFDLDPSSKQYLNCKYGKSSLLREVGMPSSGYEIVKYIYAAPGISMPTRQADAGRSRWIGYIAVSTNELTQVIGRRDIVVTFRGTITCTEWLANLMSSLTPARFDPNNEQPDVMVELGFLSLYTSDDSTCKFSQRSCREQLLKEVSSLIDKYRGDDLSVTLAGHSMGSSLAILFGYDLNELGLNRVSPSVEVPVTVYSFGGPRVGNSRFKERSNKLGLKVLRVINSYDPIVKMPGVILNEGMRVIAGKFEHPWSPLCYTHVGVELSLDLCSLENPRCVHDMETYLGLLKVTMMEKVKMDGELGFFERTKEVLEKHRSVGFWPLQQAAQQVGDIVQSLGF